MTDTTSLQPVLKAACPSCGAEVSFKSSISTFGVCEYCRSMIVRHDMDLEAIGEMAQLPDDVSPLKIGSRGKYNKTRFEVAGRLKVAWSEGYWNEWFLLFENGRHGWLAEAMGFFMLSFEVKEADKIPERSRLKVGETVDLIPQRSFFIDDMREAVCIGSEGELPFSGLKGRKSFNVDLSEPSGDFACIEYSDQDGTRLFVGRYVEFDSLEFTDLRDLSSEIKKIRDTKAFNCPSCNAPVSMMTPGLTAAVVCRYCGSTIDATNRHLEIINQVKKKMRILPLLPIGSKGRLYGAEWEVIGFMRRSDGSGVYMWDEYLLFNPTKGFLWLTQYNGHWNGVIMTRNKPSGDGLSGYLRYEGKEFKRFLIGKAKVVYVLGEFYWRVKVGDTVDVEDFIAPPYILSCEGNKTEKIWSYGRYIGSEEIREAFKIEDEMPSVVGIAPNQPSPHAERYSRIARPFYIFLAVLTVLQFLFMARAMDREVYRKEFTVTPKDAIRGIATESFQVPGDIGNLAVDFYSPVQNDWVEASIDLVNDNTQSSLEFDQGVEYYSGSDSDGPWAEGSQSTNGVISSVPGGSYHMVVQPVSVSADKSITLSLRRDVVIWSNYIMAMLVVSTYPMILLWMRRSFEVRRWSDSDFSPYATDEGGDD